MKRWNIVIFAIAIMVLFASCLSTKTNTATNSNNDYIIRGTQKNPENLVEKQLLSITVPVENPEYMELSKWSKVRATSEILDLIAGHKYFSNSEKTKFMSYLFDQLPINGQDGVTREVHVGKFFEDGSNLVIRVGTFTAAPDATIESDKVIMILTNILAMPDGSLNKSTGVFLHVDLNVGTILILNNSLLTDSRNISSEETNSSDLTTMSSLEKVMLAQSFLKDENPKNDLIAANIADEIIKGNTEPPAIIIMAMIFKYNYLLSQEDIAQAEVLWKEILSYSENVPGDMTPENLEALNGESLYMMKSLKGYFEK